MLLTGACATPQGPARPVDPAATAARLDALMISLYGSLEEHRAVERLAYDRVEGGIAACMRAARRPYRMPPFVSFYQDFTDADLGYGNGRATVIDSLTMGARRFVLNELSYARIARTGAGRRDGALPECTKDAGPRDVWAATPAEAKRISLDDLLLPIIEDPGVVREMRAYQSCMSNRYGYTVDARDDFLFAPVINRADAPPDGQAASPAWQRGVAELNAKFAADADCRRPAYEAGMRVVAANLDTWQEKHQTEIDAARRGWRERVNAIKW